MMPGRDGAWSAGRYPLCVPTEEESAFSLPGRAHCQAHRCPVNARSRRLTESADGGGLPGRNNFRLAPFFIRMRHEWCKKVILNL